MRRSAILAVVAAALAVCPTPAVTQAATIFDTYPSADGWGWGIFNLSFDEVIYNATACRFTVTGSDYWLDSVDLGLSLSVSTSSIKVSLMADNAGSVGSGLVTATKVFSDPAYTFFTLNTLSGTGIRLEKDTSYWIALEPGSLGTDALWCASINSTGTVSRNWGSGWMGPEYNSVPNLGAFKVYGTPAAAEVVPEPSALILALLGGSGAMGGRLLRRKR